MIYNKNFKNYNNLLELFLNRYLIENKDKIFLQSIKNQNIGIVTSGGFGPTINGPLAMGYVNSEFSEPDTDINLIVRGRSLRAKVVQLPFVRHQYVKR